MTVHEWGAAAKEAVASVFLGKPQVVEQILAAVLCRGHVLIEDVPGVGKTVLAQALAKCVGGEFRSIQCTPDLLPADVLGVSIYNPKTKSFEFRPGPIVANIVLVDEINRATPRTQSALLEAMAEGQVSIEGRSMPLPDPFFLIATESPVESEGTFSLPEVQKDRFFLSSTLGYPAREDERSVMKKHRALRSAVMDLNTVSDIGRLGDLQQQVLNTHVEDSITDYIMGIIAATRTSKNLFIGVSPRGSLALYKGSQALAALRGREYVIPEDVKSIAVPVLRKRILLKSDVAAKGVTEETVIEQILDSVPAPPLAEAM